MSSAGFRLDYVREDLQFAGLAITWWRKSQDRAGWQAAIECLQPCTSLESV